MIVVKRMIEVKQICISINKTDCDIADHMMERGETRSVLTNWSETTELTIQPIREEVRTFHSCQHLYSQLHSSRLSNARATTTQHKHKHSTDFALCPRCHPAWVSEGTLVGPGKDTHGTPVSTQWEGRGWLDRAAR